MAAHLKAIARGRSIAKPVYDFCTHTRTGRAVPVSPAPFIIVEGTLVLAMARVIACLDFTVFLDVPPDIRFIRRLRRDRLDRGRSTNDIIVQYLEQVRPMHDAFVRPCKKIADLVLPMDYEVNDVVRRIRDKSG